MSIKSEIKEEREYWLKSGKSIDEYYAFQENKKSIVHPPLKRAIYKDVELFENDLITNSPTGDKVFIIRNFKADNTPIVTLVSDTSHNYFNKDWEFGDNLFKIYPSYYEEGM